MKIKEMKPPKSYWVNCEEIGMKKITVVGVFNANNGITSFVKNYY